MTLHKILLVGSVPLPTTKEVFTRCSKTLPKRLASIPDGEVGERNNFVFWQSSVFTSCPWVLRPYFLSPPATSGPLNPIQYSPPTSGPLELNPIRYDDHALSAYKEFCTLREKGIIEKGVRFQVCLPTPLNVVSFFINKEHAAEVETAYEKMMLAALRRIQDAIPAKDLAIQWDCAFEFGLLERVDFAGEPWFSPLKEGIVARTEKLSKAVDKDVELGFHLCYGDAEHKHFVQPKDAGLLVEMANLIVAKAGRKVQWVHMPVPKDRTDEDYFKPLEGLEVAETQLYLGLVHGDDLQRTEKRITLAEKALGSRSFGVATECGLARTTKEEFESVMEIMAAV